MRVALCGRGRASVPAGAVSAVGAGAGGGRDSGGWVRGSSWNHSSGRWHGLCLGEGGDGKVLSAACQQGSTAARLLCAGRSGPGEYGQDAGVHWGDRSAEAVSRGRVPFYVCVLYAAVSDVGGDCCEADSGRPRGLSLSLHFGDDWARGPAFEWGSSAGEAPHGRKSQGSAAAGKGPEHAGDRRADRGDCSEAGCGVDDPGAAWAARGGSRRDDSTTNCSPRRRDTRRRRTLGQRHAGKRRGTVREERCGAFERCRGRFEPRGGCFEGRSDCCEPRSGPFEGCGSLFQGPGSWRSIEVAELRIAGLQCGSTCTQRKESSDSAFAWAIQAAGDDRSGGAGHACRVAELVEPSDPGW